MLNYKESTGVVKSPHCHFFCRINPLKMSDIFCLIANALIKLEVYSDYIQTPQPKAKYAHLINTIGQDGADLSLQEPKTSSAEDLFGRRGAEDFSVLGVEDFSILRAEDLSVFRSPKISSATKDFLIFKA
ncbi:hypothetical protein L6452_05218 [Arctium lappa]|uniref:Uncharacterized protein n=1 Tax=Arctium lappa TaxID=4217 RepID=A0ACB9EG41_ARCLA|nr:hypothetical protein L6452_05218 [Arctium lappa]